MLRFAPLDRNGDGYIHHRAASARLELECDTASAGHLPYRSPRLLLSFWSGRFGWVEPPFAKDATTKFPPDSRHAVLLTTEFPINKLSVVGPACTNTVRLSCPTAIGLSNWGPEAVFTWAGQANAFPAASAFSPFLNFSLHTELITVVSDVCADTLPGRF